MTQLEKADAYFKALEKAKHEYDTTTSEDRKQWLEELFPELRMNEDDMMRRELISFLLGTIEYGGLSPDKWSMKNAKKWIAWLEKQGNQQAKEELDACEFIEGNWIVDKTDGQLFYIQKKRTNTYEIIDIHDNHYQVPCYSMKDNYRHWNIHDAICGSVLVTVDDERPFIFKGFLDPNHPDSPVAYCGIDSEGYFCRGGSIDHWWTDEKVQPATKEQIDLLFQKMNDRLYESETAF